MNPTTLQGVNLKQLSNAIQTVTSSEQYPVFDISAAFGDNHNVGVHKGQRVYVYSADDAWREAMVSDLDLTKNVIQVKLDDTNQCSTYSMSDVLLNSDKALEELTNLTHVTPIHEASVLACLHKRFIHSYYYTNAGTTVVAINPFTDVSHLYTLDQIKAYHNKVQILPPHIYAVAEAAYSGLVRELGKVNQSIIISGESGAGKTVSAKHLLKYLTVVTNPAKEPRLSTLEDKGVKIEQRILDSNPILEAFGNAATPRNNNSSRFGKFIELQFLRNGHIQGGAIQTYLLEKTRVVHQGQGENNFHVFYQMTGLSHGEQRYPNWVKDIQCEISQSTFICVPYNQDCSANGNIRETLDAMTDIGLCQSKQEEIFATLLAILYLGNICFVQVSDDSSDLESSFNSSFGSQVLDDSVVEVSETERALERSCQLLGLNPVDLRLSLLHRSLQAGCRSRESIFVRPVGIAEARSRRDCLAMLLYSRLFGWLVDFINNQIKAESFDNIIGLLDIYGFEIFGMNSLEQLCINYANERLQELYVAHFLECLQKEYLDECLQWVPVHCSDNRPCVNILDGRAGIFSLLNEEVYLNRKVDNEVLKERLLQLSGNSQNILRQARRFEQPSFVIQHFAGEVQYSICDLVTKNKDDIPADLVSLLKASSRTFINHLFSTYSQAESPAGKKKKTLLTKFKSCLDDLISSITQSDNHYIRCLKPNETNIPSSFQPTYVLQQLRACGIVETVSICRRGYSARMPYNEFQQRYSILLRSAEYRNLSAETDVNCDEAEKENICDPLDLLLQRQLDFPVSPKRLPTPSKKLRRRTGLTQYNHARKVCATILQLVSGHQVIDLQHQFGRTKLFFTEHQLEQLEFRRLQILNQSAVLLQSAWRSFCCQRHYKRLIAARRICLAWLTVRTRRQYLLLKHATVVLQKGVRSWLYNLHLKRLNQATHKTDSSSSADLSDLTRREFVSSQNSSAENLTFGSVSPSFESPASRPDSLAVDGNLSDDSGVIVHEPAQFCQKSRNVGCRRAHLDREALSPPKKKRKLMALASQFPLLQGVHIGEGVVTRRRIPKFGARCHVRASVLRFGHVTNRQDLPRGLPDALLSSDVDLYTAKAEGSSVDP